MFRFFKYNFCLENVELCLCRILLFKNRGRSSSRVNFGNAAPVVALGTEGLGQERDAFRILEEDGRRRFSLFALFCSRIPLFGVEFGIAPLGPDVAFQVQHRPKQKVEYIDYSVMLFSIKIHMGYFKRRNFPVLT